MSSAISRKLSCSAAILALLTAAADDAAADKASTSLWSLTHGSAAIAVARVEKVGSLGGVRVAEATTLRPLKGLSAAQRFAFLAEGTWTCDESDAVVGETVLLFLEAPGTDFHHFLKTRPRFAQGRNRRLGSMPFYQIAHSGSGRMPVCHRNGREYLPAKKGYITAGPTPILPRRQSIARARKRPKTAPWIGLLELPAEIAISAHAEENGRMGWSVSLKDVMHAVRKLVKPPKYASMRDPRLI